MVLAALVRFYSAPATTVTNEYRTLPRILQENKRLLASKLALHPKAHLLGPGERLSKLSPSQQHMTSNVVCVSKPTLQLARNAQTTSVTVCSGFSWGSPKRLNFVSQMVRKMSLEDAILQLTFSKKKAARKLLSTLVRLRAKARHLNAPLDRMVLSSLSVGRGRIQKELDIKGRGRHGIIKHYQSQVTVTLSEIDYEREFRRKYRLPRMVEHRPIQARIDY